MRTSLGLTVPALPALLLALTACGGDDPSRAVDRGSEPDELSAHGGGPCPEVLPREDRGSHSSAEREPELASPDRAWACVYRPEEDPSGADGGGRWVRDGKSAPVTGRDLRELTAALDTLGPAAEDRMCTADLGPRVLLVTATGQDLTGLVVDIFGCGDIRLTDDPHQNPPGEPARPEVVPGVLTSPELAAFAREYVDPLRP